MQTSLLAGSRGNEELARVEPMFDTVEAFLAARGVG